MLAKTKVSSDVVHRGSTTQNASQSAYQPKKNFQPSKTKTTPNAKSNNQPNKRTPSRQSTDTAERKQVLINSQKSIYKPTLKRVDSQSGVSTGSKPPMSRQTPGSVASKAGRKVSQNLETASATSTPAVSASAKSTKSMYKPPTIPLYKKPTSPPQERIEERAEKDEAEDKEAQDGQNLGNQDLREVADERAGDAGAESDGDVGDEEVKEEIQSKYCDDDDEAEEADEADGAMGEESQLTPAM